MWAELWAKLSSAASLPTEARDKKYTLQTDSFWCWAFPQNCLLCYFSLIRWHVSRSPQLFDSCEKPELTHKFVDNLAVLFLLFGWKWHTRKKKTKNNPVPVLHKEVHQVQRGLVSSPYRVVQCCLPGFLQGATKHSKDKVRQSRAASILYSLPVRVSCNI